MRLQTVLVPLPERRTQLFSRVVQVDTQTASGKLQSAQEPHQADSGCAVPGLGDRGLFVCEELLERLGGAGVGG